ncbi:MAG: prepilin-type N-terminal cleavage/methylation domain-containing protein [Cyanobacteria bacterium P01_H01_bin.15]
MFEANRNVESLVQHALFKRLSVKRINGGFTLLELLYTVIIIGILATIALPNLLGQIGKARQTEGETAIGTFFKAQQGFHLETGGFETNINSYNQLLSSNALGITVDFQHYTSGSVSSSPDETTIALGSAAVSNAKRIRLLEGELEYDNGIFISVICQSRQIGGPAPSADPSTPSGIPSCGADGEPIN